MSLDIILLGAGGHCRSCIDVIEQEGRFRIAGIVDKAEEAASGKRKGASVEREAERGKWEECKLTIFGYPIVGTDADLSQLREQYKYALVTVGQITSPAVRQKLFDYLLDLSFELPVIISPLAYVSRHARICQGTIVMHQALVNAGAAIGDNCIINTKALVEHDAIVEDHSHIATGAIVNGGAHIGSGCFIGSGSNIKEGVVLDINCLVGMGLCVRKDQSQGARIVS